MYDGRQVAEAIGTAINDTYEAGMAVHVQGEDMAEDAVVITDAEERATLGRSTEAEAFITCRTSDGRVWRVYVEEHFV